MKKTLLILAFAIFLLSGCAMFQDSGQSTDLSTVDTSGMKRMDSKIPPEEAKNDLPDAMIEDFYLSTEDPVHSYLQNRSIQKFLNMWFAEFIDENVKVRWNYDTLTPVKRLDHEFHSIGISDDRLYTWTFSTDDGRCGYIIVLYGEGEEGPYISRVSLSETTPNLYDLRANGTKLAAALNETDIDLSTASAERVELINTDNKHEESILLFTDGKGDRYVCYLGDVDLTVKKQ